MSKLGTRTVMVGFDGADARLTELLMRAGHLPNLVAVASQGAFGQVLSTTPAESAVAWTSFMMGANPGRTGIFDFVMRSPSSYSPRLSDCWSGMQDAPPSRMVRRGSAVAAGLVGAMIGYGASARLTRRAWIKTSATAVVGALAGSGVGVPLARWLPERVEKYRSAVAGEPWWDRLGAAGQRSVVLRMPMTFPASAHPSVRLLAGLGVPDMRGTSGTYTLLSDVPNPIASKANHVPLNWAGDRCHVRIPGPDGLRPGSPPPAATLVIQRLGPDALRITAGDRSCDLTRGAWSGFLPLTFNLSPLVKKHGMMRLFYCTDPASTTLYMTSIEFDPAYPPADNPISSPATFAGDLCQSAGRYHTVGWETQTAAFSAGVLDEKAYLADVLTSLDSNQNQLDSILGQDDWDNFMLVIQATDQAHHMFFDDQVVAFRNGAAINPRHPLLAVYRRMDRIVGQLRAMAQAKGWRLVILSDHGFGPFRRALNLNTWLASRGYLALKDKTRRDGPDAGGVLASEPWSNVDWYNTRAYALGLAGVYLNVAGREPCGIVKRPDEYEFLIEKLSRALEAWRDPATGQPIFARIYRSQNVYDGPHAHLAPDLILGLREGYRISSASTVGGIPEQEIADNSTHWIGDHCGVDAPLIPGICLTNFASRLPNPVPIQSLASLLWPELATTE